MTDAELEAIANGQDTSTVNTQQAPTATAAPSTDLASMSDVELEALASGGTPPVTSAAPLTPAGDPSKPGYANGATADAAINESPLTSEQRLQMSLGNKSGRYDFLKKQFQDVIVDKSGDFRVKKDNTWYQVDPNTLEGVSPIEATARVLKGVGATALGMAASVANQATNLFVPGANFETNPFTIARSMTEGDKVASETGKEIAGALPTLGAVAAGIGTGGASLAATLGAAGLAGAAVEAGRTSLGRLEGTYQATPEQQMKDVGYEGLLNMAGVAVPAGVKFGINKFAEKRAARAVTEMLSGAPPEKLSLIRQTFGRMAGIADETFDRLATKDNGIQRFIDEKAGASFQGFADLQNTAAAGEVGQLGKIAKEAVSKIYEGNYNKALAAIPDNARINARDLTQPLMDMMAEQGLVRRNVSGAYEMLSEGAYRSLQKGLGLADDQALVAFDKASYKHMKELFELTSTLAETKGLRGAEGAKQVVNVGRILKNMTMQAAESGEVAQNSTLYRLASKMGATVQEAVPKALETTNPAAAASYRAANSAYAEMSKSLEPLIRAGKDPAAAAQLLSTITSKAVSKAPTRVMLQQVASQLESLGSKEAAASTRTLLNNIADRRAAIEFTKPMSQQLGIFQASSLAGSLGTAAVTGNPLPLLAVPAAMAMSSPAVSKTAFETGLKFNQMLRSVPKEKLSKLLYETNVLELGSQAIIRTPQLQEQTKGQLLNQVGVAGEQK